MNAENIAKENLEKGKMMARMSSIKEKIDCIEWSVHGCSSFFVRSFNTLNDALDYIDYLMDVMSDDYYYVVRTEKTMIGYAERKEKEN